MSRGSAVTSPRAFALAVATITSALACGGGSGSTVAPPPPPALTITVPRVVAVGATLPSTATVNPSGAVVWSIDNPAIATISTDGSVTGVAAGTAHVHAASGDATQAATVAVIPRFADITLGQVHACALTAAKDLYCWGINREMELGGLSQDTCYPDKGGFTVQCDALPRQHAGIGETFTQVAASWRNGCGLTSAGDEYCWGGSDNGWLTGGTQSTQIPVMAVSTQKFVSLGAQSSGTCALTAAGAAYCWGMDDYGQLGAPAPDHCNTLPCSRTPLAVMGGLIFRSLSVGDGYVCGLTAAGAAYCWGGGDSLAYTPVAVPGGLQFSRIAASTGNHSCAITTASQAYCWGTNDRGQLGNNSQIDSPAPVPVSGGLTFAAISVGWGFTCALTTAGVPYCWGKNWDVNGSYGFVGDSTAVDRLVPVRVSGGHLFAQIKSNRNFSCGLTADGAIYCWGSNYYGQLGNGKQAEVSSVTPEGVGLP